MHAALCTQSPVATSQLSVEHGLPSSHACSMHLSALAPFFLLFWGSFTCTFACTVLTAPGCHMIAGQNRGSCACKRSTKQQHAGGSRLQTGQVNAAQETNLYFDQN